LNVHASYFRKKFPQSAMLITAHVIQLNVAKAKNQQFLQAQLCHSHIFCLMNTLQCIFESSYMIIILFAVHLNIRFAIHYQWQLPFSHVSPAAVTVILTLVDFMTSLQL
jgi:hypothetical protein